ncbi:hypothetical protein ACJ73_06107 [Blastomyces percursus]|uniref:Uncharacterized protein n=1 Tax=Blastomyces percursus TaxID=1658174 RepID=A0A1J9R232_9EURO|nr:hypothetical protein ACJ73_06107 [Blastomyces percursus]
MSQPWVPYSWDDVHGPEWGHIGKVPMNGIVYYDRWIQVSCGFLLFAFFGFGKDATLMYRAFLIRIGLGRFFPSLEHPHIVATVASDSTRFGSFSSRAKLALKKKQSTDEYSPTLSTVRSNSESTNTTAISENVHHFANLDIINKPLPPAPCPPNSNSRVLSIAPVTETDFDSDTWIYEKMTKFREV